MKGRRTAMRRPSKVSYARLRAGVPQAVIAEIGSRPHVIGAVSLPAIGDVIAARCRLDGYRAVIDIAVVIIPIAGWVVARTISVALRGKRATDHSSRHSSGKEAAAMMMVAIAATAVIGTATAAISRARRAAADMDAAATASETAANCGRRRTATAKAWAARGTASAANTGSPHGLLEARRSLGDAFIG
jgi:hypothetical protein